ncbi:ISAon1 family transposase [Flavobacterium adhaerens]|uniref:ISAon1 family transposase n=1 Tax=Flavobacterium adhaerens TaxID=3149043 RepID=UPI003F68D3CD
MGGFFGVSGKKLLRQYKNKLSDFKQWNEKPHAKEWLIFPKNISPYLSLDEVALTNGELYTVLTSKKAKGKKGSIVALIAGTKAETVIEHIRRIDEKLRRTVTEITLDMANSMKLIAKKCFTNATQVIDRFHVQKLALEALQELRISHRWIEMDNETIQLKKAKENQIKFIPDTLSNGDTKKQLLARSRYLLYKCKSKWTRSQQERATLLFELYPDIKKAYSLNQQLRSIYNNNNDKNIAMTKLAHWYDQVEKSGFKSFNIVVNTIMINYRGILNYFDKRSTNASAESFNAKIKNFRNHFRGVRNTEFFLYRLTRLFA